LPHTIPRRHEVSRFMDMTDAFRYFAALALVLALVGGAGLVIRRYGLPGITGGAGRRLSVVETLMLGKITGFSSCAATASNMSWSQHPRVRA